MYPGHRNGAGSSNGSDSDPVLLDHGKIDAIRSLDPQGKAGLLKNIVTLFIEKSPELIEEIDAALEAGDAESLFRAAHSLKSSSATIGAMGLSETCSQLEALGRKGSFHGVRELTLKMRSEFKEVCFALTRLREGL